MQIRYSGYHRSIWLDNFPSVIFEQIRHENVLVIVELRGSPFVVIVRWLWGLFVRMLKK